jgi:hypothetical protein
LGTPAFRHGESQSIPGEVCEDVNKFGKIKPGFIKGVYITKRRYRFEVIELAENALSR